MQASQAPNETPLPRAIRRQVSDLKVRIAARETPESEPTAVGVTPPADTPDVPQAPSSGSESQQAQRPDVDPRESDPSYWKSRFEVTSGMLRRERDERKADAAHFHQRLNETQEQIRTLQASTQSSTAIDITKLFTPEQIDKFGEEQCETMAQTAMTAAQTQIQKLVETEIQPIRDRERQKVETEVKSELTRFRDRLAELVPGYETIDVEEPWLAWLAQVDPESDLDRGEILDRHIKRLNADAVAKMFKAYLKTKDLPVPPVAVRSKGASSGDTPPQGNANLTAPSNAEVKDYYARSAKRQVSDKERVEFEARLKLRTGSR